MSRCREEFASNAIQRAEASGKALERTLRSVMRSVVSGGAQDVKAALMRAVVEALNAAEAAEEQRGTSAFGAATRLLEAAASMLRCYIAPRWCAYLTSENKEVAAMDAAAAAAEAAAGALVEEGPLSEWLQIAGPASSDAFSAAVRRACGVLLAPNNSRAHEALFGAYLWLLERRRDLTWCRSGARRGGADRQRGEEARGERHRATQVPPGAAAGAACAARSDGAACVLQRLRAAGRRAGQDTARRAPPLAHAWQGGGRERVPGG